MGFLGSYRDNHMVLVWTDIHIPLSGLGNLSNKCWIIYSLLVYFNEDNEKSSQMKITALSWGGVCLLLGGISLLDLLSFIKDSSNYPIGSEGPSWAYLSELNYMISGLTLVLWSLLGLWLSAIYKKRRVLLCCHILLTILYLLLLQLQWEYPLNRV